MESVDLPSKPSEIITKKESEGDILKVTDDKGDIPPELPRSPIRLGGGSEPSSDACGDKIKQESEPDTITDQADGKLNLENNTASSTAPPSVFSFGKISSALPTGYLNYFTSKPPPKTSGDTDSQSLETHVDIEGGEGEVLQDKSAEEGGGSKRTWAEWANEKSVGVVSEEYLAMLKEPSTVEIDIAARSVCRAPFLIPKGNAVIWAVRIKLLDLGFAVRLRRQGLGGAVEDDIVPMKRYNAGEVITGGRAAVDYARHVVFVFDNTYSTLRAKKCAHRVQVGPHLISEDESLLAEEDVMESPFARPVPGSVGAPSGSGQLEALSAVLSKTQEAVRQAGTASLGAVQGGLVVAVGAPMMIQKAIVASLQKKKPVGEETVEGKEALAIQSTEVSEVSEESSVLETDSKTLPVLDMDHFGAMWVQLEEGSTEIISTVIPRPTIEEGFPLISLPQHLKTIGSMHVIASGEVTGGCQIFSYAIAKKSVIEDIKDENEIKQPHHESSELLFYALMQMDITWRGPSQESPGYDEWTLKATLRTPCPDKSLLKDVLEDLKLSEAFFIVV